MPVRPDNRNLPGLKFDQLAEHPDQIAVGNIPLVYRHRSVRPHVDDHGSRRRIPRGGRTRSGKLDPHIRLDPRRGPGHEHEDHQHHEDVHERSDVEIQRPRAHLAGLEFHKFNKWAVRGSNPRPTVCKVFAFTTIIAS